MHSMVKSPSILSGETDLLDRSIFISSMIAAEPSSMEKFGTDYEVFLSFRGPDTRQGFASTLHHFMVEARVRVFMDDEEIRVGDSISGELERAINGSKVYIPIFSRDYASSAWCLRELSLMVDCSRRSNGKHIFPIFYDVTVDDLKLKTDLYRGALRKHGKKFPADEVREWKDALGEVSRIKGWELQHRGYPIICKAIVNRVLLKLKEKCGSSHLVGMTDLAKAVEKLLDIDSGDVRFVVIHGISGTGKTTLAKFLFDQLSFRFQGCSFLADIRESVKHNGLEYLKKQLYRDIPDDDDNGDEVTPIKERFLDKKVLIVLDDVDQRNQIMNLVGKSIWFGPGSRIIVTTTDLSVLAFQQEAVEGSTLNQPKEVWNFAMKKMNFAQALQLFSRHAFGEDSPPPDYDNLSHQVVHNAGRLPLILEVIGSFLHRKCRDVWIETSEKLRKVPSHAIQEKLKISYDALSNEAKQIFLDIACFFVNKEKTNAIYMWEACNNCKGIEILLTLSLVKGLDNGMLWMHDYLRNLGRDIVRMENLGDPGARSRLWVHREALEALMRKGGKQKVEALRLNCDDSLRRYTFTREEFASMKNLRFLELYWANVTGDFENLLSELRWLSWHYCPGDLTATNVFLLNLVILDLSQSCIKDEWAGWSQLEVVNNLRVLDLTGCRNLKKTPCFSRYMKLERLILEDCKELIEIDDSISELKGLKYLNIKGCDSLKQLPEKLGSLESLEELIITKENGDTLTLPDSVESMTSLSTLKIANLRLSNFLQSVGGLQRLERLSLSGCSGVKKLPSLGKLTALVELDISKTDIVELPDSIKNLKELKLIKMEDSSIRELPSAIGMVEKLEEVRAKCSKHMKGKVPDEIGMLSHLRILDLSCTGVSGLPETIRNLPSLQSLDLENCDELAELPDLPRSLTSLRIKSCSLHAIPNLSALTNLVDLVIVGAAEDLAVTEAITSNFHWIAELSKLENLELHVPSFISSLPCEVGTLPRLKSLRLLCRDLQCCLELPSSLSRLSLEKVEVNTKLPHFDSLGGLSRLHFEGCVIIDQHGLGSLEINKLSSLVHFSAVDCLFNMVNGLHMPKDLRVLSIEGCAFHNAPLNVSGLKHLKKMKLFECEGLVEVHGLGELQSLQELEIHYCESLERLDDLSTLRKLEVVIIDGCDKLTHVGDIHKLKNLKHTWICDCPSLRSSKERIKVERPRSKFELR